MTAPRPHLVIVGAGMVTARLLEEIARREPTRFRITVVGAEASAPYDRIQLSAVLAGTRSAASLDLLGDLADRLALDLVRGRAVTALDPRRRRITLADGTTIGFDLLVLATGAEPVRLPLPGAEREGVRTFRDLDDVDVLTRARGRAVVVGGGLLGLEAAAGLRARGLDVALVHLLPWLMERQLDEAGGAALAGAIERLGIRLHLGVETEAIVGDDRVRGLRLVTGATLAADLVVMAVGIRPRVALARTAGLACGRGIQVDDGLATSEPGVFALGECAEHRGICYGLVAPLYAQAAALAGRLCGEAGARYTGSVPFTSLKVAGVEVFSAGAVEGDDAIVLRDPARGVYRKLVLAGERLAGAVLVGDASEGAWYARLIEDGTPVGGWRERLMFGRAYLDDAARGRAA